MGISLGQNPSGAMSQVGAGFRAVGDRTEALIASVLGVVAIWTLAAGGVISGWQFTAGVVVWAFAVTPLTPLLFEGPHPSQRVPLMLGGAVATVIAVAVPVASITESNGWRVVMIVAFAGVVGAVLSRLYGPLTEEAARMAPSPDLIGVHTGFNRGDIIEADAEIGLTDQELDASREAALAGRGAAS